MPVLNIEQTIELSTGGGTFNIDPTAAYGVYNAYFEGPLTGSWTIQPLATIPSSLIAGMTFTIFFKGGTTGTLNGNTLTVFGESIDYLTASQDLKIDVVYYLDTTDTLVPLVIVSKSVVGELTGAQLYSATGVVSGSTLINQLNTTPQIMIAAPPAGYVIKVVDAIAVVDMIASYTTQTSTLQLLAQTASLPIMQATGALQGTGIKRILNFVEVDANSNTNNSQLISAEPIVLSTLGYNPSGGNASAITVYMVYRLIQVGGDS